MALGFGRNSVYLNPFEPISCSLDWLFIIFFISLCCDTTCILSPCSPYRLFMIEYCFVEYLEVNMLFSLPAFYYLVNLYALKPLYIASVLSLLSLVLVECCLFWYIEVNVLFYPLSFYYLVCFSMLSNPCILTLCCPYYLWFWYDIVSADIFKSVFCYLYRLFVSYFLFFCKRCQTFPCNHRVRSSFQAPHAAFAMLVWLECCLPVCVFKPIYCSFYRLLFLWFISSLNIPVILFHALLSFSV